MSTHTLTHWLSHEVIESPLRRMTGSEVRVSGNWTCDQFKGGRGEGLGVWRISGMMTTPDGEQPWSMVLKGWACENHPGAPTTFNWPWREAELYQSHILENLPGVSAPACYGSAKHEGAVWVWLEDLTIIPQPPWTVDQFATAARLLGRMNGAYLAERPLPSHPSLSRDWMTQWVDYWHDLMSGLDDHLHDPRVRESLPSNVATAIAQLWERRQTILDTLHSMPTTFSHLDAFPRNIFMRPGDDGEEMVLIDWSFAGFAAVGEELSSLCFAGAAFNPSVLAIIDEVEAAAYDAYIDGLRDAGWNRAGEDIRRIYLSSGLLRYIPGLLSVLLSALDNDAARDELAEAFGVSPDHYFDHFAAFGQWIGDHIDDV